MQKIQLYIEGQRVDLFEDESVVLTQTIQNVKDVQKVFTDYSKTFSVPATKNNNSIFKHYYKNSITNGFDARKRKSANLELNFLEFREGKIKFKDVRKITIGMNKKDILSYRCKRKSAFYNCFVVILRLKNGDDYKESHVKVFNTGKLELPGIQCDKFLKKILNKLVDILNTDCGLNVNYLEGKSETVLINSNFNCGYYINRNRFCDILKFKYKFQTSYDPCSYPGIMSKFYYDPNLLEQTGIKPDIKNYHSAIREVSFMVFRTGSVLIVGKCCEPELREIYKFIKILLQKEYLNIYQAHKGIINHNESKKIKKKKVRRRDIIVIQGINSN